MKYNAKVAVCSEIRKKHSKQNNLPPCENLKSNELDILTHKYSLVTEQKVCEVHYLAPVSNIVMRCTL